MISVLIVEDNDINREVLNRKLVRKGFTVTEAESGEQALGQCFGSDCPDVVITDLNLPGKGGWDIVKELKSNPNTKKIPVIALTATFLDEEMTTKLRDAQFLAWFSKPAPIDEIVQAIGSVIAA